MTHLYSLKNDGYVQTGVPGTRGPGRCAVCSNKIVRGDDWTVEADLATCEPVTA